MTNQLGLMRLPQRDENTEKFEGEGRNFGEKLVEKF